VRQLLTTSPLQRNTAANFFALRPVMAMSTRSPLPNGAPTLHAKSPEVGVAATQNDVVAAAQAVLKPSVPMPSSSIRIRGIDFSEYATQPVTIAQLSKHFSSTGFQASNLGRAIEIINNMVRYPVMAVVLVLVRVVSCMCKFSCL